MLRFDHMTSDFHPIYLVLGDASDLSRLAQMLRQFAEQPEGVAVADRIPNAKSRTKLLLVPADDEFGMRPAGDEYHWRLNAWQAEQIAGRIELLTPDDSKSGNDIFEVGSEGEIPVKVSRGEFTEDFLVTKI